MPFAQSRPVHFILTLLISAPLASAQTYNDIATKMDALGFHLKDNRKFEEYVETLEQHYERDVMRLGSSDIWIDSGAGEAQAQISYLRLRKGKAVCIALDQNPPLWAQDQTRRYEQFLYPPGRDLEKYTPAELYPASLITDVYGALAYTKKLSQTLSILLNSLKPGGKLYFRMDETIPDRVDIHTDRNLIYKIIGGKRVFVPLKTYFDSIAGVRFVQGESGPHEPLRSGTVFIRYSGEPIVVPPLKPIQFVPDGPPKRIFWWH